MTISLPRRAWRIPIGKGYDGDVRPRDVDGPALIDDGPWAGAPIGGLGSGSIGRTQRGDFARWHLDPGRHRFETIPACQFSLFVGAEGREPAAQVLSTIRPDVLPTWGWGLPVGSGTYHALFPFSWFEYDPSRQPIRLVQRQFSPVLPRNYRESSLPVAVFDWDLENTGDRAATVGLLFTWQNVLGRESGADCAGGQRHVVFHERDTTGIVLHGPPTAGSITTGTMCIAAGAADGVELTVRDVFGAQTGEDVWADFAADGRLDDIEDTPPATGGEPVGAALAATVRLASGERRRIRFVLSWDLPTVTFGAGTRWYRRHTRFFGRDGGNAAAIAREGLACGDDWVASIEAWQAPFLDDVDLPDWYVSALFNELYFMVDGGTVWTAGRADADDLDGDDPAGADGIGRFGLMECFDYPFYNTLDVNLYASWALLGLWPELERSAIHDFIGAIPWADPEPLLTDAGGRPMVRKIAGAAPHDIGGPLGDPFLRPNQYKYQDPNAWRDLNSAFVLQLWRDVRAMNDPVLARDGWPAVVQALDYLARFDLDGDGLPEHAEAPDQTFDTWAMRGPGSYTGLLWIAALRAAARLGVLVGDTDAVTRYDATADLATAAFESKLWNGRYYRLDGSGGPASESVMAAQLVGQWYADATGLGAVLPADRVESALRTIFERNVAGFAGGEMGAVNGTHPDGTSDRPGLQQAEVWVGVTYALAAMMLGRGLAEEAWQTARGAATVTWTRGLWFRTPEAYDAAGRYRASIYLRPLAIWAIEHARGQLRASGPAHPAP